MNTLIVSRNEIVDFKKSDEDIIDIIKEYINEDPILSSNLRHLTEDSSSNLLDYLIGLGSNGYNAYYLPNVDVDETMKYFVLREGIAMVDGKPIRGHYKLLGELDDNSKYPDYLRTLQGINDTVNVSQFLSKFKDWDLIDFTVIAAIPEVRALMDITNTKVIINNADQ